MQLLVKSTPKVRKLIFQAIKKKILAHVEKLEKEEAVQKAFYALTFLMLKGGKGLPIGTIRTWKGKKFIKVAPDKWKPKYDSRTRGAALALSALKKKIAACDDEHEMMRIMLENRSRFSDDTGAPLPFVQELHKFIEQAQESRYNKHDTEGRYGNKSKNRSGTNGSGADSIQSVQEGYREAVAGVQQQGNYFGISKGLRERLAALLERRLGAECSSDGNGDGYVIKLNGFKVYSNVKGATFQEVFFLHKSTIKNGELVDYHSEKGSYDKCKCFLSADGLQGFAIEPDGNIISVYNADVYNDKINPDGKRGWTKTVIALAVKNGGNRLDCYNSVKQPLASIYAKYGFKAVSRMPYNMAYDHDNIAQNHDSPDVVFMAYTDKPIQEKTFTKDEYDEALQYRNSIFHQAKSSGTSGDDSYPEKNYPHYKGKGQEAVDFIAKQKGGQVRGAFHRSEIGDIDVVWGAVTDAQKHTGYGLAHIIDKHGMQAVKKIGEVVEKGEFIVEKTGRTRIETDKFRIGLKKEWFGNKKTWIVTSYDLTEGSDKFIRSTSNYTGEALPATSTSTKAHPEEKVNSGIEKIKAQYTRTPSKTGNEDDDVKRMLNLKKSFTQSLSRAVEEIRAFYYAKALERIQKSINEHCTDKKSA